MPKQRIVIVTGASAGLGKEFVRIYVARDEIDAVYALARNREKLEALKREMGEKVIPVSVDLADVDRIAEFGKQLQEKQPDIRCLVNNAGYARFCSYDDISIADSVGMVNLNINGLVAMGLTCLPYMSRGSRMINIASQASFQPLPYQNIYSSTKAFVRNYTRALNVELRDRGITATAVCPGWMRTELIDKGLVGADRATNRFCMMVPPEVVARKAVRDADKGKDISVYSLYVKTAHLMAKLLPQRWMMRIWLWQQRL